MKLISLYDCQHPHILGQMIYCAKGHRLGNGSVKTKRIDDPSDRLVFKACQGCPDHLEFEKPFELSK